MSFKTPCEKTITLHIIIVMEFAVPYQ